METKGRTLLKNVMKNSMKESNFNFIMCYLSLILGYISGSKNLWSALAIFWFVLAILNWISEIKKHD